MNTCEINRYKRCMYIVLYSVTNHILPLYRFITLQAVTTLIRDRKRCLVNEWCNSWRRKRWCSYSLTHGVSDTYMRKWTTQIVQLVASRLFSANLWSEAMMTCSQLHPLENITLTFESSTNISYQENALLNSCVKYGRHCTSRRRPSMQTHAVHALWHFPSND